MIRAVIAGADGSLSYSIKENEILKKRWEIYRKVSYYVRKTEWDEVFAGTKELVKINAN